MRYKRYIWPDMDYPHCGLPFFGPSQVNCNRHNSFWLSQIHLVDFVTRNRRGFAHAVQSQTLASECSQTSEYALGQVHHKLPLGPQKRALGHQKKYFGHFCGSLNDVALQLCRADNCRTFCRSHWTVWQYLVISAFFVNVRKSNPPPTPYVRICSHLVDPPSPL